MSGGQPQAVAGVWWEALRADPTRWLLEGGSPALAWRVLVEGVGRPPASPAVARARSGANACEPIATLLAALHPDGSWADSSDPWEPGGGGWRVVASAQLGADPGDPRLQAACRRVLRQTAGYGGFARRHGEPASPCLTARAVHALAWFRWDRDLRCQEALAWLEETAGGGGGWTCSAPGHTVAGRGCAVAAVAALSAMAEVSGGARGAVVEGALGIVIDGLRAAGTGQCPSWWQLGHPNLDRTDVAEALWSLASAEVDFRPAMTGALRALQEAQDEGGRWSRGVPVTIAAHPAEAEGRPSRWITLKAVRAMRAYAVPARLPRRFPQPPLGGR